MEDASREPTATRRLYVTNRCGSPSLGATTGGPASVGMVRRRPRPRDRTPPGSIRTARCLCARRPDERLREAAPARFRTGEAAAHFRPQGGPEGTRVGAAKAPGHRVKGRRRDSRTAEAERTRAERDGREPERLGAYRSARSSRPPRRTSSSDFPHGPERRQGRRPGVEGFCDPGAGTKDGEERTRGPGAEGARREVLGSRANRDEGSCPRAKSGLGKEPGGG